MKVLRLLATSLIALYPLLVYSGASYFEPRFFAILILLTAFARWRGGGRTFAGLGWEGYTAFAVPVVLSTATAISNAEIILRLYPVAINITLLFAFSATLFGEQSMIERIARIRKKDLDEAEVRYTRVVTEVWCAFFVANGAISAWTAVRASRELWALYNGCIAYIFIAVLFCGEWVYRRRIISKKGLYQL